MTDNPRQYVSKLIPAVLLVAGAIALVTTTSTAQTGSPSDRSATTTVIYDDGLRNGFGNWSWADTDLQASSPVASGASSIRVDFGPWSGLSLGNAATVTAPPGGSLRFSIHGGVNPQVVINVVAMDGRLAASNPGRRLVVPGGRWTEVSIPLSELGGPSTLAGFWWQEVTGGDPTPIFIDDVSIVAPGQPPTAPPTTAPPTTAPTTTAPPTPTTGAGSGWAFEETFDGHPSSPSQDLLPKNFEFVATHRSHPKDHFTKAYPPFLADHSDDCSGPNPEVTPLPQRLISTTQDSNGSNPDPSFFICHNHMMSSMGEVEGYSVTSFWPRQEFNFADGGTIEFDVSLNDDHGNRSWWELMIVPRDQLKVAPGPVDSPISEAYAKDRIVLDFRRNVRTIKVGTGELAPEGWLTKVTQRGQWDYAWWRDLHPEEPGLDDRRVRPTMRVRLERGTAGGGVPGDRIVWGIETPDGSFDEWSVDVPGGLPFDQGLVVFKTHSYNPVKDGNLDAYTFHWDNLRFDGPVVGRYDVHEASDVIYLQRNGDRPIGDQQTVTINLDTVASDPVLFGQLHQPKDGQVLLSINGGPNIAVAPYEYDEAGCFSTDWKSFRLELDPSQLRAGANTLTWKVGPRPNCTYPPYHWDGFSVKYLQIQTARPS